MSYLQRLISTSLLLFSVFSASILPVVGAPDEGMYTPDKIASLPLKKRGLKIKPEDIYNPNGPDISDAVVRLSIGCSAEFVSPQGLILTNHHCGFDALVSASTPERDYAKTGYRADSMKNELIAKDYSVFITNRVEDVTAKILNGTNGLTGEALAAKVKENTEALRKAEQGKAPEGHSIRIQELNSGYFYYLYETKEIKDVRLVYAPPQSIGFFGGDPDNFEWTRHTGDFTFLRAYVSPDGKSVPYAANNVPYKPEKFLSISLDGIKDGDFTMILGYPGGTTRYRESQAVAFNQDVSFPFIVSYLQAWTNGLVKAGENDEEKRVKLQAEVFSLNNSIKAYDGGVIAMKRAKIVAQKRAEEERLATWINADPARKAKYGDVLAGLKSVSDDYYKYAVKDRVLRTIPNQASAPVFGWFVDAVMSVQRGAKIDDRKKTQIMGMMAESDPVIEREVLRYFLKAVDAFPVDQKFAPAEKIFGGNSPKDRRNAENAWVENVVANGDLNTADAIIGLYGMSAADLKAKFPQQFAIAEGIIAARGEYAARGRAFGEKIDPLRLQFQKAMAEMKNNQPYPDANSTLRFTFGNVRGYQPREAVTYAPFTTLAGVMEKETGVDPFTSPEKLRQLFASKDYGRYGVNGTMPVNFLTTNDIIGGNSGSPVLNAKGEQIGIAFDGNYEGLGNDMFFDPTYGRTIVVDIRYVLFLTEKLGDAKWIVDEMTLVGGAKAMKAKA